MPPISAWARSPQVTLDGTFEQLDGTVTGADRNGCTEHSSLLTRTVTVAVAITRNEAT